MIESLQAAREFANQLRFSGDTLRPKSDGSWIRTEGVKNHYYRNALQISPQVTPELADRLSAVCESLKVPPKCVAAFVHASPEIQAGCYADNITECVLRFSSSLIDLLDEREFAFVAGHELGHFLLGHGITRMEAHQESIEFMIAQRSQEISVDRIGLLACGSLDVAIRALMKTVSGLSDRYLRFDVSKFVSQLPKSALQTSSTGFNETHPSIIVRCRALLWFSLSDVFARGVAHYSSAQIAKLDTRIQADLFKYVDGPAREHIERARNDLTIWMATYEVIQDGIFEKREQAKVAELFGHDVLEKLKGLLSSISSSEAEQMVNQKIELAREELKHVVPASFETEVRKIDQRISTVFARS